MSIRNLLSSRPEVVNIGLKSFASELAEYDLTQVTHVEWQPGAGGDPELNRLLSALASPVIAEKIRNANTEVIERVNSAEVVLEDVIRFGDIYPELTRYTVLHAGPPITWEQTCGPLRGAITGALRFEGLATSDEDAVRLIEAGKIEFRPNHDFAAVGPMTGITTISMPVFVVRNRRFGNSAYCTVNEGLGKVMRFGANDDSVLTRLAWIRDELGPALHTVLAGSDGINLKVMLARALAMGDEMHQRNIAASSLFVREFVPLLLGSDVPPAIAARVATFISGNEQWFLNLAMAAFKATTDPAMGVTHSTVVTAMARNGYNFGVRVSGLGTEWFEAPVEQPEGLYFPGYAAEDANPDIGDSTIVESVGFGGMAMAAAPAVTRFVGIEDARGATDLTLQMQTICAGYSTDYQIPSLGFRGVPTGIDIRHVVETGIRPIINTGIAHRNAGVGQIGAGVVYPPLACFTHALRRFVERYVSG